MTGRETGAWHTTLRKISIRKMARGFMRTCTEKKVTTTMHNTGIRGQERECLLIRYNKNGKK